MKTKELSASSIWGALLRGAFAGFLVYASSVTVTSLRFQGVPLTPSAIYIALTVISPLLLVGLAAGLVAHYSLAKLGWIPRLTWLLLTLLYSIAFALGSIIANIIIIPFGLTIGSARFLQILTPVFVFGVWMLLARLSIQAVVRQSFQRTKSTNRQIYLLLGQILLVLGAAASWVPGMGTLILGGTISLVAMTSLALYGTGRRTREERTPAFLITLWAVPVLTMTAIILVVILGF